MRGLGDVCSQNFIQRKVVQTNFQLQTHSRPIIFIAHSQGGTVVKGVCQFSTSA